VERAGRLANDGAQTDDDQHPGQVLGAEACDPFGDRSDVAVEGQETDPAECGDGEAGDEVVVPEACRPARRESGRSRRKAGRSRRSASRTGAGKIACVVRNTPIEVDELIRKPMAYAKALLPIPPIPPVLRSKIRERRRPRRASTTAGSFRTDRRLPVSCSLVLEKRDDVGAILRIVDREGHLGSRHEYLWVGEPFVQRGVIPDNIRGLQGG
jgi:hypothetical protein